MEWKTIHARYGTNACHLYLNKLHVASVYWDGGSSRNDNNKYKANVHLPGMKDAFTISKHPTEQDAKGYAELVVKRWVNAAGLEFKNG